jgi:hypothetical protein
LCCFISGSGYPLIAANAKWYFSPIGIILVGGYTKEERAAPGKLINSYYRICKDDE